MERYQEYKDSGEQWLGEIPSHWKVRKAKFLWTEKDNRSDCGNERLLSVSQYDGVKPTTDESRSESLEGYKIVEQNELVINIMLAWLGGLGVSSYRGIVSPAYCVYKLDDRQNPKYMHYLYKTPMYLAEFARRSTGIVPSRWRMYTDDFGQVLTVVPPLSEQTAMVAYLDRVTAQIDKAIAQQQRMIDLLNERKQIIIQHAVTKGLDPNAEMVDSGVEWIGKIPKGWKLYKLKHLLQAPLKYGANESASEYNETDPRYIRITDIDNEGNLKNNTVCTIPLHKALPYMLQKGDLLLARSGATVGKSYLFQEDYKACYAGYLIKACFSKKISPQFVYLYTQSASYSKWKDYILIQSTIQNISAEKYANLLIPTPPVEVQLSILKYLDPQLDKMNVTLANFNRKIEVLRERKQIIINEVVTGKVKVS